MIVRRREGPGQTAWTTSGTPRAAGDFATLRTCDAARVSRCWRRALTAATTSWRGCRTTTESGRRSCTASCSAGSPSCARTSTDTGDGGARRTRPGRCGARGSRGVRSSSPSTQRESWPDRSCCRRRCRRARRVVIKLDGRAGNAVVIELRSNVLARRRAGMGAHSLRTRLARPSRPEHRRDVRVRHHHLLAIFW